MYEFITGRKRGQAMLSEQAESCVGHRDVAAERGPSWGRRVYSPDQAGMGGLDALSVCSMSLLLQNQAGRRRLRPPGDAEGLSPEFTDSILLSTL